MRAELFAALLLFGPVPALAQGSLLQAGVPVSGQVPMYSGTGSQAVVQASGPAGGGGVGLGLTELLQVNRVTGTGPNGAHVCLYDHPTTNSTGYHYFCLDAGTGSRTLMEVGNGGGAATQPFQFIINGTTYDFPFAVGGIVGPSTTVIGDVAYWNNTQGTLLADSSALRLPLGPITLPGGGFTFASRANTITNKISDRLFVGQAAAVNDGGVNPTDWLATNTDLLYQSIYPQLLVLSTSGTLAITGASRSSDQPADPAAVSIGISGIGINDQTGRGNVWGGYFEVHRNLGNTGATQGVEIETANYGSNIVYDPYTIGGAHPLTAGLTLAAGAGLSPTWPTDVAIYIANNSQPHNVGLLFEDNSLTALGSGGNGIAINMALGQSIRWTKSTGLPASQMWAETDGLHLSGALFAEAADFSGAVTASGTVTAPAIVSTGTIAGLGISGSGLAVTGNISAGGGITGVGITSTGNLAGVDLGISGTAGITGLLTLGGQLVATGMATSSGGMCVGITPGGQLYISGVTC